MTRIQDAITNFARAKAAGEDTTLGALSCSDCGKPSHQCVYRDDGSVLPSGERCTVNHIRNMDGEITHVELVCSDCKKKRGATE